MGEYHSLTIFESSYAVVVSIASCGMVLLYPTSFVSDNAVDIVHVMSQFHWVYVLGSVDAVHGNNSI